MFKDSLLYFSFICLFLLGCGGQRQAVYKGGIPPKAADSLSISLANRMDGFVQSLVPHTFNGALLLEVEGKLILKKGYGYARREDQLPFSTTTISPTAHLARQLTAAAILKLSASKALHLRDSLSLFFDDLPPEKKTIRLEQLLQHTSGLPLELKNPLEAKSKQAFLQAVWQSPLDFEPGLGYQFSTVAYRLLAAVVEQVSGQEYEAFIRKKLLKPAGMDRTGYLLPDFEDLPIAKSREAAQREEVFYRQPGEVESGLWHLKGSSGLLSNAEDMFRWEHSLLRGKLLPLEVRDRLWAPHDSLPDEAHAYGWGLSQSILGTPMLVHESRENGFFCQMLYLPQERISLVLIANQMNLQVEQLGEQLVRMVLNPQFVPSPLPFLDKYLVRLPLEEDARNVRTLVSYFQGDVSAVIPVLIEQTYSPDFKAGAPDRIHYAALASLRERLQGTRLEQIRQNWPFYNFTFFSPEHLVWYRLKIGVESHDPHRVTSIGLEITDPVN